MEKKKQAHRHYFCDVCLDECDTSHYKCFECASTLVCEECWGMGSNELPCRHNDSYIYQNKTITEQKQICKAFESGGIGWQTLAAMVLWRDRPCVVSSIENDKALHIKDYKTYGEIETAALNLLQGLYINVWNNNEELTFIPKPTQVGIWMQNSADWVVVDVALAVGGFTSVPLDPSGDPATIKYILDVSECHTIIMDLSLAPSLVALGKLDYMRHVIFVSDEIEKNTYDTKGAEMIVNTADENYQYYLYDTLIKSVEEKPDLDVTRFCPTRLPNDIFTIIFTSGSTGKPKGVIQTHAIWSQLNFRDRMRMDDIQVRVVYRPLCYSTDRYRIWVGIGNGGRTAILRNATGLFDLLPLIQPTSFSAPPLVWAAFQMQFQSEWRKIKSSDEASNKETNEQKYYQLLKRYAAKVGSRCKGGVGVGGAKAREDLMEFLKVCFERGGGTSVYDNYGTSEIGGITMNGYTSKDIRVMLIDVPEMGFYATSNPPQGELCVMASSATPGYWKAPEETKNLFIDDSMTHERWVRTGDIVEIRNQKIIVMDRRSNLIKLANSIFISPEYLEGIFGSSDLVQDVFIYAESSWEFPLAVVTLIQKEHTESDVLLSFRNIAARNGIKTVPHGVIVSEENFSVENQSLTISHKLSRPNLRLKFQDKLRVLYANLRLEFNHAEMWQRPDAESTGFNTYKSIANQLVEAYRCVIRVQFVDLDNSASHLGADSITIVQLKELIFEKFNISLTIQVLWTSTIQQIADLIHHECVQNTKEKSAGIVIANTNYVDNLLLDRLKKATKFEINKYFLREKTYTVHEDQQRHIFLTGATGFIGRSVLKCLLQSDKNCIVTCLVRARNELEAIKSLHQENKSGWITGNRLRIVCGDFLSPKEPLGIDKETLQHLQLHLTTIIHCGAHVNHTLPFTELEKANVESVRHLFNLFVFQGRVQRFVHLSTIQITAVSDETHDDKGGAATEILSHQKIQKASGYLLSKWAAERLISNIQKELTKLQQQKHQQKSYEVSIIRCGMTSWDTMTGIGNQQDWLCRLCSVVSCLQQYPRGDHSLNLLPVDWTADVICACATKKQTPPTLLNLSNPNIFDLDIVFQKLGARLVSVKTWQRSLDELQRLKGDDCPLAHQAAAIRALFPHKLPGNARAADTMPLIFPTDDRLVLEESCERFTKWILQEKQQTVGRRWSF